MKKTLLLITVAISFSMAQVVEPVYDDFWLGKSADCRESEFYTTRLTTYYQKSDNPLELDLNHPNNKLRLVLSPEGGNANMFGVAVMASQLISAKSDRAKVSMIYSYAPPSYGPDLNSIRLQSVSRVD